MPPKYLLGHLGRGLRCSCSAAEFDWAAAYYPQASSAFTPPGRPICFLSHIPFPGVSCSSDLHLFGIGAQEPEHLSLCSLSLSQLSPCLSVSTLPPRPLQLLFAPPDYAPPAAAWPLGTKSLFLTRQVGKDNPGTAGETGVSLSLIAGASRRGVIERSQSPLLSLLRRKGGRDRVLVGSGV